MKTILLSIAALLFCNSTNAQMTTRVLRDSLFIPWELVYGPDDHIWFTQKNGFICRLNPDTRHIDTLFHETNTVVNGEGGMLGMALHPQFPAQPYVYVAYEYTQGSYKERIVRYTYGSNVLASPQIIFDNITGAGIHNGCRLLIVGDKLFITTGDAANQSTPQNLQSVNGKTLRINLDGSIPSDNPLPGNPVWTWGNRNAQGLVYANGKLYSSEHGPGSDDELNILEKGRNYGWPNVTGFCNTGTEISFCNDSNVVEPLVAWTPTLATSGIDYYNHAMFPALQHSILMTTLKNETLYQLKLNGTFDSVTAVTPINIPNFGRLRDICVSPEGRIYISTSESAASGTGTRRDQIIE
ncbi:MAG: PQQ-dependent sugar dehydrogenase, partial [Sphingobacteriales bacterium]